MSQFAIQRRLEIDAAHRVPDHGSKCFNLHGHRYVIEAVCEGPVIEAGEQNGMVMDFGFLKECMIRAIHDPCDHGAVFYYADPLLDVIFPSWDIEYRKAFIGNVCITDGWKVLFVDCVPTAENLARVWHTSLENQIELWFRKNAPTDPIPKLAQVRVWETPNCVAWYPVVPQIASEGALA